MINSNFFQSVISSPLEALPLSATGLVCLLQFVRRRSQTALGRGQGRIKGGATRAIAPRPRWKGAPRDEIYLFQIKYSFEKIRDSEVIQGYNSILYSYVALSI